MQSVSPYRNSRCLVDNLRLIHYNEPIPEK